jgi:hypothetical protein
LPVAPINPMLKAPKAKRPRLRYDGPLSIFTVDFNLRRYNSDDEDEVKPGAAAPAAAAAAPPATPAGRKKIVIEVGRCRLTLSNPR